ncbi:MAG: ATP-binding cassette domain-containing protein [Bacteroidales bacterium]|nr:ATP-binding cassette domain-containing protein [Bacteroidales bacterium]
MLKLQNIHLSFGPFAISNINLELKKGDYFVLLGPSGAGKSVILELIAGILQPQSGRVFLNNEDITNEKIQDRSVGLVFQDFAIFPHLNVEQNIAYPLKIKKWKKEKIRQRVEELALQMNIFHLLKRSTQDLSGGEKQRVALARTLALSPTILLLDEPLASLDVQLKKELRSQFRKLHKKGQTIIHVTHDFEEALLLADKVAIFNQGEIIQQGSKNEVFRQPKSEFVAHFIGVKNYYEVKSAGDGKVEIEPNITFHCPSPEQSNLKPRAIMIHSGDIELSSIHKSVSLRDNEFIGTVLDIYPAYRGFEMILDIGVSLVVNISQKYFVELNIEEGDQIICYLAPGIIQKID